jgi:uncharacterized protein
MIKMLNKPQIESLLQNHVIGRLGCTAGNKIFVIPIAYAYDGRYIYCSLLEENKINMMRKYPEICFEVDEIIGTRAWQSVTVYGKYEELAGEEAKKATQALINKIPELLPDGLSKKETGKFSPVLFRIKVEEKIGLSEKERN